MGTNKNNDQYHAPDWVYFLRVQGFKHNGHPAPGRWYAYGTPTEKFTRYEKLDKNNRLSAAETEWRDDQWRHTIGMKLTTRIAGKVALSAEQVTKARNRGGPKQGVNNQGKQQAAAAQDKAVFPGGMSTLEDPNQVWSKQYDGREKY